MSSWMDFVGSTAPLEQRMSCFPVVDVGSAGFDEAGFHRLSVPGYW